MPYKMKTAHILDGGAARYAKRFGTQLLGSILVHAAMAGAMALSLWLIFAKLLPVLNARSQNAIVTGLYVIAGAAVLCLLLWLARRIALIALASGAGKGNIRFAVTAGLAEILCDIALYGAMGFILYKTVGLGGLGNLVLNPSLSALAWLLPCGVIVLVWLTAKLLVIPAAAREKKHFLSAIAYSVRLAFTERRFRKLLLTQIWIFVFYGCLLGAGFFAARAWLGVPAFFAVIPFSQYLEPVWHLFLAYLAAIPFMPYTAALHAVCADAVLPSGALESNDTAGLGSRAAAFVLDMALFAGIPGGLGTAVLLSAAGSIPAQGILLVLLLLCAFLLLAAFEAIAGGRTPGKLLLGIRAVSADGKALSFGQAYLRGILRLADVCAAGALLLFFGQYKTRLGDMAAKTRVVYTRDLSE